MNSTMKHWMKVGLAAGLCLFLYGCGKSEAPEAYVIGENSAIPLDSCLTEEEGGAFVSVSPTQEEVEKAKKAREKAEKQAAKERKRPRKRRRRKKRRLRKRRKRKKRRKTRTKSRTRRSFRRKSAPGTAAKLPRATGMARPQKRKQLSNRPRSTPIPTKLYQLPQWSATRRRLPRRTKGSRR